jgi:hypothetical protein
MDKDRSERDNTHLLELAIFMASSTRDAIKWRQYAPLRLLQSLIKVLDLPNKVKWIEKGDDFLEEIRTLLEENVDLRRDEEAFETFMDDIVARLIKEYESRLKV